MSLSSLCRGNANLLCIVPILFYGAPEGGQLRTRLDRRSRMGIRRTFRRQIADNVALWKIWTSPRLSLHWPLGAYQY